jgi:hypothetical protein
MPSLLDSSLIVRWQNLPPHDAAAQEKRDPASITSGSHPCRTAARRGPCASSELVVADITALAEFVNLHGQTGRVAEALRSLPTARSQSLAPCRESVTLQGQAPPVASISVQRQQPSERRFQVGSPASIAASNWPCPCLALPHGRHSALLFSMHMHIASTTPHTTLYLRIFSLPFPLGRRDLGHPSQVPNSAAVFSNQRLLSLSFLLFRNSAGCTTRPHLEVRTLASTDVTVPTRLQLLPHSDSLHT